MTEQLVPVFAALADETRWRILTTLAEGNASASALARRLPISRQAIAKHLTVLQHVGLVESVRAGREVQYRVIGSELSATARRVEALGQAWDRRLATIKDIAEDRWPATGGTGVRRFRIGRRTRRAGRGRGLRA